MAAPCGLSYTRRQLYYEVCRELHLPPGLTTRSALLGAAVGLVPSVALRHQPRRAIGLALVNALVFGALRLIRMARFTLTPPLAYTAFADQLETYCDRYGTPPGLLLPSGPPPLTLTGDAPDLTDYGLPRLLICQHDEIAHMLLANRFHMETSCAILSLAAATPLPDALREMLLRTPEAHVYLLHDASAAGVALVSRLRTHLQLPAPIPISAVGLRPVHAFRLHLFATRVPACAPEPHDWPAYLTPAERAWLQAGWCAEVAAVRPARLLLALRRILLSLVPPPFQLPDWRRERAIGFLTWPER